MGGDQEAFYQLGQAPKACGSFNFPIKACGSSNFSLIFCTLASQTMWRRDGCTITPGRKQKGQTANVNRHICYCITMTQPVQTLTITNGDESWSVFTSWFALRLKVFPYASALHCWHTRSGARKGEKREIGWKLLWFFSLILSSSRKKGKAPSQWLSF